MNVKDKVDMNQCSKTKHLIGKVVIVTGGNSGIGFETAKDLANRGARVIIACRNEERGTKARDLIIAATQNKDVHYRNLNLASFDSIKTFSKEIIETEKRLDILINNAGVTNSSSVNNRLTENCLHFVAQTNYFGPFLLTNLLLPKLKESAPSRIINVAASSYTNNDLDIYNLNDYRYGPNELFNTFMLYNNSKLCIILMTLELEKRLKDTGVTANACHPGNVDTKIWDGIKSFVFQYVHVPVRRMFSKTSQEGAKTSIYLAVSPEVDTVSGRYFSDCKEQRIKQEALDTDLQRHLWNETAKIVNLKHNLNM